MGDLLVSSLFYGVIGIIVLFIAFYSVVVYYKKQDEKTYDNIDESKCQRCGKREETVDKRSDGGLLCNRCAHAKGV